MLVKFVVKYFRHFSVLLSDQAHFRVIQPRKKIIGVPPNACTENGFRFADLPDP